MSATVHESPASAAARLKMQDAKEAWRNKRLDPRWAEADLHNLFVKYDEARKAYNATP